MTSKKRSAKAKQIAEFKAQLGGMDDIFEREQAHRADVAEQKEAALRRKSCESKNRYRSRAEAEEAIAACAAHGTFGLHSYRCDFCKGWHLTHKPQR